MNAIGFRDFEFLCLSLILSGSRRFHGWWIAVFFFFLFLRNRSKRFGVTRIAKDLVRTDNKCDATSERTVTPRRNINRRETYFVPWYFSGWITSVHRKKKKEENEGKKNRKPTVLTDNPVIFFLGREIAKSWNRVKYVRLLFEHMYLLWSLTHLFGPIYRVSRNDFVNESK